MPFITSRLAWALEVDPANLVARVKEEAQYHFTANTLRLCNVFGKGDHATITELPKELIDLIEIFLRGDSIESAASSVARAENSMRCFADDCVPWDQHFSDEQKLNFLNRYREGQGEAEVMSLGDDKDRVHEERIVYLGLDRTFDCWQKDHARNVADWQQLVREPGQGNEGVFTEYQDFILRRYGLVVFVGHTQGDYHEGYAT
ncbi:hypothetical protein LTR97_001112 [Elasticomyces elasticus]|uniref:Uncharacterized protein n=1 Tax=Elasticomyces elasticus TaxID=574655 RepID=A0AAN7WHL3_9PEZI|nr:hypothetical protein LTR97_001112 [Elasticomyces elasticus]